MEGEIVICKLCFTGFVLDAQGKCVEVDCTADNCAKCTESDDIKCEICLTPYALTSEGECVSMSIFGCLQSLDNQCLKCNPGFAPLPPQGTIQSCVDCLDFDDNSKSCNLTSEGKIDHFIQCSKGYFPFKTLEKNQCLMCSETDLHCLICAQIEEVSKCLVCMPGYKLITFTTDLMVLINYCQKEGCPSFITNCLECERTNIGDESYKCIRCRSQYALGPGQLECVKCITSEFDDSCSRCFIEVQHKYGKKEYTLRECYENPDPDITVARVRNCVPDSPPIDCAWELTLLSCLQIQNCDPTSCKKMNMMDMNSYCGHCQSPHLLAIKHDEFITSEKSNYPYLLSQSCISGDLCKYFWDLYSNICFIGT